jgi:hypothetical protein
MMEKLWIIHRQDTVTPYKTEQEAIEAARQQVRQVKLPFLVFALAGCVKRADQPIEWTPVENEDPGRTVEEIEQAIDRAIAQIRQQKNQ